MAVTPKTIYLEPDEEITSVIDKIRKTEFADIVLVIPKGASISQSVVNLKLIKKKAEDLSKAISIVTGDKVARALAEKVGIPVAATVGALGSVAVAASHVAESEIDPLVQTDEVIFNKEPVAIEPDELTVKEGEDTEAEVEEKEDLLERIEENKAEKPKNLMPKFPWLKVALFAGVPLLILFGLGFFYLPQAKASVYMKADRQPVSLNFVGQSDAKLDANAAVVPTQVIDVSKESSKKFPATGQKDDGTKASGTVQVYLAPGFAARTWVSGTRIALGSDSSLVYTTNSLVNIVPGALENVSVTAQNPGDKYNGYLNKTFVAVNDPDPTITCTTAMSGGTTKTVSYVTQGDFNAAKDSLTKDATNDATSDFTSKSANLKVIDTTKKTTVTSASATPDVGENGSDFTLTVKVDVKALAVNLNDLTSIVRTYVTGNLGTTKNIIDDGSSSLNMQVDTADIDSGKVSGTITTTAYVAVKLDQNSVKTQLEGLNDQQATNYLKGLDGVDSVQMEYFPPFLKSFPRIKDHIIINVKVSDASKA